MHQSVALGHPSVYDCLRKRSGYMCCRQTGKQERSEGEEGVYDDDDAVFAPFAAAADGKGERDSTRFQGAASLGARGSGCTDKKTTANRLCRLKAQQGADRPGGQSLVVVSPCNGKLILNLQLQGLHLSHHVHCNEHCRSRILMPTTLEVRGMVMAGPQPNLAQRGSHCGEGKQWTDLLLKGPKEYGPCVLSFVIACLLAAHQVG